MQLATAKLSIVLTKCLHNSLSTEKTLEGQDLISMKP